MLLPIFVARLSTQATPENAFKRECYQFSNNRREGCRRAYTVRSVNLLPKSAKEQNGEYRLLARPTYPAGSHLTNQPVALVDGTPVLYT